MFQDVDNRDWVEKISGFQLLDYLNRVKTWKSLWRILLGCLVTIIMLVFVGLLCYGAFGGAKGLFFLIVYFVYMTGIGYIGYIAGKKRKEKKN